MIQDLYNAEKNTALEETVETVDNLDITWSVLWNNVSEIDAWSYPFTWAEWDYVYYRDWVTTHIYRTSLLLSFPNSEEVTDVSASFGRVFWNYLYFRNNDDNRYLYRTNLSSAFPNKEKINEVNAWYMQVDSNYIYCRNANDWNKIYRSDLNAVFPNQEQVSVTWTRSMAIFWDKVYFIARDNDNHLYSIDTTIAFPNETLVLAEPLNELVWNNLHLYYTKVDESYKIYRFEESVWTWSDEQVTIDWCQWFDLIQWFDVDSNTLCFSNKVDDKKYLYYADLTKTLPNQSKATDTAVDFVSVSWEFAFYQWFNWFIYELNTRTLDWKFIIDENVKVNINDFSNNLSSSDNNLKKALKTINDLSFWLKNTVILNVNYHITFDWSELSKTKWYVDNSASTLTMTIDLSLFSIWDEFTFTKVDSNVNATTIDVWTWSTINWTQTQVLSTQWEVITIMVISSTEARIL